MKKAKKKAIPMTSVDIKRAAIVKKIRTGLKNLGHVVGEEGWRGFSVDAVELPIRVHITSQPQWFKAPVGRAQISIGDPPVRFYEKKGLINYAAIVSAIEKYVDSRKVQLAEREAEACALEALAKQAETINRSLGIDRKKDDRYHVSSDSWRDNGALHIYISAPVTPEQARRLLTAARETLGAKKIAP